MQHGKALKRIVCVSLCLIVMPTYTVQKEPWTWLYRKIFSQTELEHHAQKNVCLYQQEDVYPFTQLIFSWNGYCPAKGYISFWVQERNMRTKKWSSWHKMFDWGDGVRRSYTSDGDGSSSYKHVRLEIKEGNHADAFRVSIVAKKGADLALVKGLSVALADNDLFASELADKQLLALPSVYVDNVPCISQMMLSHPRNNHLCSPTSCSMLMTFLLGMQVNPVAFAQKVYDEGLDTFGSWPFNMAYAFERSKGTVWFATARFNSFSGLHKRLQKGIPVVVSVRGTIKGAPKSFPHGHLLVVVGWDAQAKKVICHDPAFSSNEQVEVKYALSEFLRAWENSRRLAYVAYPHAQADSQR